MDRAGTRRGLISKKLLLLPRSLIETKGAVQWIPKRRFQPAETAFGSLESGGQKKRFCMDRGLLEHIHFKELKREVCLSENPPEKRPALQFEKDKRKIRFLYARKWLKYAKKMSKKQRQKLCMLKAIQPSYENIDEVIRIARLALNSDKPSADRKPPALPNPRADRKRAKLIKKQARRLRYLQKRNSGRF